METMILTRWQKSKDPRILNLETPAGMTCPNCFHWPISLWKRGELAGTVCDSCGWWKRDFRHVYVDFVCHGCGRAAGTRAILDTVKDPQRIIRERFRCDRCSALWLINHDPRPWLKIRYDVLCACGCGRLCGWADFWETVSRQRIEFETATYFHTDTCQFKDPGPRSILWRKEKVASTSRFAVIDRWLHEQEKQQDLAKSNRRKTILLTPN